MSKVLASQQARHQQLLQAFHEHLPVTRTIQGDLLTLLKDLAAEESWSDDVVTGATEWASDIGVSWRALRRTRFRPDRVPPDLLEALRTRLTRSLHGSVPSIPPYNAPSHRLFTYIPPALLTDKISRPVAIITLRLIRRDVKNSLDPLKEWAWWIAEMGRRTIRDCYDVDGTGEGEGVDNGHWVNVKEEQRGAASLIRKKSLGGCVVIVDCKGTGLKNLELDFLPYLVNINHNHYPGLFETVYVVNYTWTQSALWTVAKRVLPESALEKIVFLSTKEVGEMFDLDRLPRAYGGSSDYNPFVGPDATCEHYARPAAGAPAGPTPKAGVDTTSITVPTTTASLTEATPMQETMELSAKSSHPPASPQSTMSDEDDEDSFQDAEDDQGETPVMNSHPSVTDFHRYLSSSHPSDDDPSTRPDTRAGVAGPESETSVDRRMEGEISTGLAGQHLASQAQNGREGSITSSALATRTSDTITDSSSLTAPSCAIVTPSSSRRGSLVCPGVPSPKGQ